MSVTVTLEIPEDLATILRSDSRDLSRAALEALAVEAYRAERLSDAQLRRILGLDRFETDALLKAHGVWLGYSVDDFQREGEISRRLRKQS